MTNEGRQTRMRSLSEALPDLVLDIASALIRIGRGDVADQLREVQIERWTYDEFADAAYLYLRSARQPGLNPGMPGATRAETLCPFDDPAINLELDNHRRLVAIEVLDGRGIVSALQASSPE